MKLFIKIFIAIFLVTATAIVLGSYFSYKFSKNVIGKTITENYQEITRQTMAHFDYLINECSQDIASISEHPQIIAAAGSTSVVSNAFFTDWHVVDSNDFWQELKIYNLDQQMIVSYGSDINAGADDKNHDQKAIEQALTGKLYISSVQTVESQTSPIIVFAHPIYKNPYSDKSIIGAIVGHYSWPEIAKKISVIKKSYHTQLLDEDGLILASNAHPEYVMQFREKYFSYIEQMKEKSLLALNLPGSDADSMIFIATSGDNELKERLNWVLTISIPIEVLYAPARQISIYYILFFILFIILILDIIIFLIYKLVILPVEEITETANKFAQGQLQHRIKLQSRDEIGILAASFNTMAEKIQDYYNHLEDKVRQRTRQLAVKVAMIKEKNVKLKEAQLATERILSDVEKERMKVEKEKEKIETIVENISEGLVIIDVQGQIIAINQEGERITHFYRKKIVGQSFIDIFKPREEKADIVSQKASIIQLALTKARIIINRTISLRKNDGSHFYANMSISPLEHGQKVYGAVVIFHDITRQIAIDRQKTEFISIASHQLRTPLSSVKWILEMLLLGDFGKLNNKQIDIISDAHASNQRMIKLVNDLLNVSRIEQGRVGISPVATNLTELIRTVIGESQLLLRQKKHTCKFINNIDSCIIKIDPLLIRQVIQNLLTNAIKYTPAKGYITIQLRARAREIEFSITDTGYGIPIVEQDRIFQKFFRANNALTKETEGNGLGLYLAKSIVESSGGRIWFISAPAQGATFYFTLPKKGSKIKKGEVGLLLS